MKIGVDLGGSKFRIGLVNSRNDIIGDSVRKNLLKYIYKIPVERLIIKPAVDGELNALIGAAMLYDTSSK